MSGGNARAAMLSERNSVIWVNGKDKPDGRRRFIREHAASYPKLGISASRRYSSLFLGTFFVIMLFSASLFGYTPFTTILCNTAMAALVVVAADSIVTGVNIVRFNDKQLESGGEMIAPWNERAVKSSKTAMIYVKPALTVIFAAAILVTYYNDTARQIQFRNFPVFYWALVIFSLVVSIYPAERVCPNIFRGAESGMVFGGALFSYETLKEINFSSSEGDFELYHKGQVVARGVMLSDDRYHLLDILSKLDGE